MQTMRGKGEGDAKFKDINRRNNMVNLHLHAFLLASADPDSIPMVLYSPKHCRRCNC